jgi:hypothetical protein
MPDSPDTSAAAIVRDHAFEPRTEAVKITFRHPETWADEPQRLAANLWLCAHTDEEGHHCRLAEAAHIR